MKVLVIIVTYNGMRWIDKCLTSVQESILPVDCIVIDNNSQDETVATIKGRYGFCKLVESEDNLGFGKANNIGLQYAIDNEYDYVYLLNQDAWILPDTISHLVEVSQHNPQFGILSPMQMSSGMDKLDKNFELCCQEPLMIGKLDSTKTVNETSFVMAAHWLIPRFAILKVGGFSPSFPHYGEDHNYIHRILFQGLKIGIVPSAKAVHDREFREEKNAVTVKKTLLHAIAVLSNPSNTPFIHLLPQILYMTKWAIKLRSLKGLNNITVLLGNYKEITKNRRLSFDVAFLNNGKEN